MIVHLQLYETLNAEFTYQRAADRFTQEELAPLNSLRNITAHLKAFEFVEALKAISQSKDLKNLTTMLACYHIPKMFRGSYSTIGKDKLDKVLQFTGKNIAVHEFGFEESTGAFYKVNQNFGYDSLGSSEFKLDQDRVQKLTKVVAFLEHQNYD